MNDSEAMADPALERIQPEEHPTAMMAAEHVARYRWAAQFVTGKRVLDAGCGTGYGAAMMSAAGAAQVVGVDIDGPTIEAARTKMPAGVELVVGDLESLAAEDASFDVVVCLEAIEHVNSPETALDEFRRVLVPDGVLVLSTPNRDVVIPGNPHHIHEYTPDELGATVSRRFSNVRIRRQHTWIATAVLDDDSFAQTNGDQISNIEVRKWTGGKGGAELTTLIVAGQTEIDDDHPVLEISSPVELRQLDRTFHDQAELIAAQARHNEELRADRDSLRLELDSIESERDALRTVLVDAERDLAHLREIETELEEASKLVEELRDIEADRDRVRELNDIVLNSTSWRVTAPLRRVMEALRSSAGR